jgi:hypothetical protein
MVPAPLFRITIPPFKVVFSLIVSIFPREKLNGHIIIHNPS